MNELEQKAFDELTTTNKLLLEMNKNQRKSNKNIVKVSITGFVCLTAIIVSMIIGFFVYESQFEYVDTHTTTSDSYNTESKTYDQSVSVENSSINNVEGNQYNDNATHNE